jgi:hypothetical protein
MEKLTDSALLISEEADYDGLPKLSFWRNPFVWLTGCRITCFLGLQN